MSWMWIGRCILLLASIALVSLSFVVGFFYFRSSESEEEQKKELGKSKPLSEVEAIDHGAIEFEALRELIDKNDWEGVRLLCLRLLTNYPSSSRVPDARNILTEMNLDALLSRDVYPGKRLYTVVSGDSINSIASRNNCSYSYIVKVSGLTRAPIIQPNDQLVVCPLRFRVIVHLDEAWIELRELGGHPEESLASENAEDLQELPERFFAAFPIQKIHLEDQFLTNGNSEVGDIVGVIDGQKVLAYDKEFASAEKQISLGNGVVLRMLPASGEVQRGGVYLHSSDLEDLAVVLRRGQKVQFRY